MGWSASELEFVFNLLTDVVVVMCFQSLRGIVYALPMQSLK